MSIRFIWFDIGYTLLYQYREKAYQELLLEFGVDLPLEKIEQEFHLTDKLFFREYPGAFGKVREAVLPWFSAVLNYRLGVRLNILEFAPRWMAAQDAITDFWRPFDCVRETLANLKARSFGLGIISNWAPSARDLLHRYDLGHYFDPIIISSEVGYAKPDSRIFEIALERAGVTATESLYIGDNYYDDVLGCRSLGLSTLIINRFGRLGVEEIKDQTIIKDISEIERHLDGH
jgi:putative hydrolase of the HAD superfamily